MIFEYSSYTDLYDILPNIDIDFKNFAAYERMCISPTLKDKGWILSARGWYTGEQDSFGPLSRCINAVAPSGKSTIIVYG